MKYVSLILIFLLLGCKSKETNRSNLIYIVNTTLMDRRMIADFLTKLGECHPKIVAINALFDRSEKSYDDVFANSIRESKNVVLVSDIAEDETIVHSDSMFVNQALSDGVTTFEFSGDILSYYQTFKTINGQIVWSFPVTIVSYFKEGMASEIMRKTKANVNYEIVIRKTIDDFQQLTEADLNGNECLDLTEKIILMGDVGPGDKDLFVINESGDRTYATIVIANLIEQLLDGEFKEVDERGRSL